MDYEVKNNSLIELLLSSSAEELHEIIEEIHPQDILDAIKEFEGDKKLLLANLPVEVVASIIDQADDEEKDEILALFPEASQKLILNQMSSDELVDLLESVTPDRADYILEKLHKEDMEEVRELLSYEPDTAGGIMATEFLSVKESMTVGETLKYLQSESPDAETAYYLYVLDDEEHLKGVVSLRDIVISNFDTRIFDIMHEKVISVPVNMDQEEVGHIFEKYGFLIMPVVNDSGKILGIVTVDDIMEVLREENTEDIYRLAGVQEGERVEGSIAGSVRRRLPWLYVNLITAIAASLTVSMFEGTIQRVVTLASFMPIVAGMGGNTGTQTLTIIVRAIALGELTFENARKVLIKEMVTGVIMGIALGGFAALIGFVWVGKPAFGIVIGLAMLLNMAAATLAGFLVPLTLKKLNIDPALASAVFVTTVTDVLGFFFFLGLATVLIESLI